MTINLNRRTVLRGMVGGASVSVGLPMLDCFLNTSGTAYANGAQLPVIFGTWFTAMGWNPGFWEPKTVGAKYENNVQLKPLDKFRDRINVYSGLKAFLDGRPMATHLTGAQVVMNGAIPVGQDANVRSIDQVAADAIGTKTRFRSLEVSYDGSPSGWSRRSATSSNPSEISPLAFYTRIFGPDFKDPNAAEFIPDPKVMVERSVLSAVSEQRILLSEKLGASDQARLDEYFTSLRELEQKLDLELQRPAPLEACAAPNTPEDLKPGVLMDTVLSNGKIFSRLLAHALACGQTRIFNVSLSSGASGVRKPGSTKTFHMDTHEEPVDPKLGYQPETTWFMEQCLLGFADALTALESIKEGDGNLLDRILIYYGTDHGYARLHTLENVPLITAGRAGGKIRTGYHLTAPGDTVARVGLTALQAVGVPVSSWGTLSNETSKAFNEVLA